MEANIGICQYCGTTVIIDSSSTLTEEEANHAAIQRCQCPRANRHRGLERIRERIDTLCGENEGKGEFEPMAEDVVEILLATCELIYDMKADSAQFVVNGEQVKMSVNGDGYIKIERKRAIIRTV